jgi:hypothetical protein
VSHFANVASSKFGRCFRWVADEQAAALPKSCPRSPGHPVTRRWPDPKGTRQVVECRDDLVEDVKGLLPLRDPVPYGYAPTCNTRPPAVEHREQIDEPLIVGTSATSSPEWRDEEGTESEE